MSTRMEMPCCCSRFRANTLPSFKINVSLQLELCAHFAGTGAHSGPDSAGVNRFTVILIYSPSFFLSISESKTKIVSSRS